MFAIIAGILVVCWLLGLLAFHITAGLFHLILVVAVVLLVVHFLTGGRRGAI